MARITDRDIFDAAQDVLLEKGVEKARLTDIAKKLNISHAALYKHFPNKEALFDAMQEDWLSGIDHPIISQASRVPIDERETALHDWLQLLLTTRETAFQSNPEMMHFYRLKVKQQNDLIGPRVWEFAEAVERIMAWDSFRQQRGMTIMMALTYFYHPFFSDKWNDNLFQTLFESTWLELLPIVRQEFEREGD
ncbi:TetR/AcrR family transcriptional regulator [Weissella diestrammenae]|uniref:TetR/AcrR family transcriptional regulator n=1 Tax=Weissella diestrammenae TaxID=1162633 RepID=A0A7G9T766_9LACO|nr:TetR/AcrR family transcriptional regulator [Weissella diestrammenae]MCM0582457.1 TetR/AcrR family transcriptional regulator [Weissella diestrammenae]QNN75941.1 TetR/AcrR family transcriptional regulator [Weissella diestrammenae]